jgi:uncharacterized protein (TIGR02099 family)
MIRLLHGALARLLYAGTLILVLAAILISLLRLALPLADRWRTEVAAQVAERLGGPVRVGALSLDLDGWSPRLSLDGAVLADPSGGPDLLRLEALELDLDALASLRLGSPQVRGLTLVGAHLTLVRSRDGTIRIEGLGGLSPGDPHSLELFLHQGRLNLTRSEIRLVDEGLGLELPRLADLRLQIGNDGDSHRLALSARPLAPGSASPADSPAQAELRLVADLHGPASDLGAWQGGLYLSLGGADLAALLPPSLLAPGSVRGKGASLEVWGRVLDGAPEWLLSRIEARRIALGPDPADPGGLTIDRLGALARLARDPAGWRLGIRDLGLSVGGGDRPRLDLDLDLDQGGRPLGLDLAAQGLDLAQAGRVLAALPPGLESRLPGDWDGARGQLESLRPSGRVDGLAVSLRLPQGQRPSWRAKATVRGLGLERSGPIPGVSGLDLELEADREGGTLRLHSGAFALDLTPIFAGPIRLDRLEGLLDWGPGPDGGLRLGARELVLENADLAGRGQLDLTWPAPLAGAAPQAPAPFVELRASFQDGDISRARDYLPTGILHPELVHWLTRALVAGRVTQGDLLFRGPLAAYPFRGQEGTFELILDYERGVLDYLEGWPPIEDSSGTLVFLNQGLRIDGRSGRIYGSELRSATAEILDLWTPVQMPLHGECEGPLADGLRLLKETPLAQQLGPLAAALEVEGRSRVMLDLSVPLQPGGPLALAGRLDWPPGAAVMIAGTPIRLAELQGSLGFTLDSLSAESIGARLWGRPLTIDIATRKGASPSQSVTEISARSRLGAAELAPRLPSSAWTLASGETDLGLTLSIDNADLRRSDLPLAFVLGSDLRGVALDLPPPLGKPAGEARALKLAGSLVPGRSLSLRGGIGDLGLDLSLGLGVPAPGLERGRVRLGSPAAPPPDGPGLTIDGALARASLPAWTDWWARVGERLKPQGSPAPQRPGAQSPGPGPLSLDLRIAALDLGGPKLTEVRLSTQAQPGPGPQSLGIESRELAGRLTWPAGDAPLALDLGRLDLAALLPPPAGGPGADAPPAAPAQSAPTQALDLRVADLRWGQSSLGRLAIDLRPDIAGLRIARIELDGPGDTRVRGDAAWIESPTGGRSRLALELKSADLAPVLGALDYAATLSAAPMVASLSLDWPGPLESFALARAQGYAKVEVGAGRLLEVEPGVGRVLGILNLGALRRRLSLDFSDLYRQGFAFERIGVDLRIGEGRAELRRFEIEGPASVIRVGGFTDLRTRTFDQTVRVEPSIGTGVALAGVVAGGPVVGAAVLLVDKVSGGAIARLGSYGYRVTGPWGDPVLEPQGWEPFAARAAAPAAPDPGLAREDKGGGAGRARDGAPVKVGKGAAKATRRDENLFLQ